MKKLLLLVLSINLALPTTLADSFSLKDNVVRGFFFGDTHFARGFEYFDRTNKKEAPAYFKFFYDENGAPYLKDMDFVSVNFESSMFDENHRCASWGKSIVLATDTKYLDYFKSAWITHFDISNNHSYDCGKGNFEFMEKALEKENIHYYWDWRIWEENNLVQEINGQKLVFLGFNETTFYNDWDEKSKKVKMYSDSGYNVIVNIHWGQEYKSQNNDKQKGIAERLVKAWAKAIIGHHPHVVQNYEIIDGVPVFYSLWNFMFDQPFEETLTWMWVYMQIWDEIQFKTIYFDRSNPFYDIKKLDFGL